MEIVSANDPKERHPKRSMFDLKSKLHKGGLDRGLYWVYAVQGLHALKGVV